MSDCQWDREVKARKKHICDVCRIEIAKGVTYHKQSGIRDGDPYTFKAHIDCAHLFWRINWDRIGLWDEAIDIFEFDPEDVARYRGAFPHAVNRVELKLHRWESEK